MPKEAFLKLKPEKQQAILRSARIEFGKKGYEEASVNDIISTARISRGSFYQYFYDKDDIYYYLLTVIRTDVFTTFTTAMTQKCTIFDAGLLLFDKFMDYFHHENQDYLKQIALSFNPKRIIDFVTEFDNLNPLIFTKVADFKKLDVSTSLDIKILIEAIISYVCEKTVEVFCDYVGEQEAREMIILFFERLKRAYYIK